uniref:Uncharacterized protein n=1 Tax=Anguilla anguilla TaxID=7936 RepID=A0A0E9W064_ANGAN
MEKFTFQSLPGHTPS